ncbi:MAG: ABC transporter substrate-binding protein [Flavobacteriales bacterium]
MNQSKRKFTDQMDREVEVNFPPLRIVSLVPSQTELLFDLGLEERAIGVTKFCVHPLHWRKTKDRVGGTKTLDIEKIISLNPDLIIGNKEENEREQIELLNGLFPVWMSDIYNLADSLNMIAEVGQLVDAADRAEELKKLIEQKFNLPFYGVSHNKKALYLIWRKPWMGAGNRTFIHDMLARLGFENVLKNERYPEISKDELQMLSPQVVFLSSEPYPFKEQHVAEILQLLPKAKIFLADGEMFSWYGSRLLMAADYFSKNLKYWHK